MASFAHDLLCSRCGEPVLAKFLAGLETAWCPRCRAETAFVLRMEYDDRRASARVREQLAELRCHPRRPPSDRQLAYALHLGIRPPWGVSAATLDRMIHRIRGWRPATLPPNVARDCERLRAAIVCERAARRLATPPPGDDNPWPVKEFDPRQHFFLAVQYELGDDDYDGAVAVAVVWVKGGRIVDCQDHPLHPQRELRRINRDNKRRKTRAAAPTYGELWRRLAPDPSTGFHVVSWNAAGTRAIVEVGCALSGLEPPPPEAWVCTAQLARRRARGEPCPFGAVCQRYGVASGKNDLPSMALANTRLLFRLYGYAPPRAPSLLERWLTRYAHPPRRAATPAGTKPVMT